MFFVYYNHGSCQDQSHRCDLEAFQGRLEAEDFLRALIKKYGSELDSLMIEGVALPDPEPSLPYASA